jgi:abortive infection bacteriophage resistance protein
MYPFLTDKSTHIFKENTEFQNVLDLYAFDAKLRSIVFEAIAEIEISVRTAIIYYLAHKHGAFWVAESTLFEKPEKYESHLRKLKDELNRSDEKFLSHFRAKYSDPIPPAWISLELASFGTVSLLFANLKDKKSQKEIAACYDLPHDVFLSWIHTLAYVRNICAHHARLWNRRIRVVPSVPKSELSGWSVKPTDDDNRRLFYTLAVIAYFLNKITTGEYFSKRLKGLLESFPHVDAHAMGCPDKWETVEPFGSFTA